MGCKMKKILVTGAGGFIGSHLVKELKKQNNYVIGVDIKKSEFGKTKADEFYLNDLRFESATLGVLMCQVDEVYALAADMGGMGYISFNDAQILRNNLLINLNTIHTATKRVKKYLFSSSACVYPQFLQKETLVEPLKETDAYPADPQDAYGWEKLLTEKLCEYYKNDCKLDVRVARFHNVYGPEGTYDGGREKAPAALCRKIALAKDGGKIEIWGDGKQTRSFCYISDCVRALITLMNSKVQYPINIGREELISITGMADLICEIADKKLKYKYIKGPQGVRGRNSDNELFKRNFKWEPEIKLKSGLRKTYKWIVRELIRNGRI